ncbi:SCO6745 family protein [[Mycobacterium] wendilense]|uniref:SalK n=1 Tax=[Mycobacterium] wendilense TaxID=3064284 RepID=A0ABM9ME95_9MYCO|nr:hypothetical protein [Mycolicibacterium sp. MU0050]CAJ1583005.1 hypothetical protein MU0050_002388 [Mycolicibacterium sp. MU0050]
MTTAARRPELARRFFDRFEPIHAVTYFAPESRSAMDQLGCRGFWEGYFAGRAAPLETAAAPVVTALFYNFSAARVAKSLTRAWATTSPAAALRARSDGAAAALTRCGVADDDRLEVAAALAAKAAATAPLDGRALFAANAALPWPDDPVRRLWHAATLLREHRGDGHVAALVAAGVTGRESNVLQAAGGTIPADYVKRARDYDETEWQSCTARLAARGLLTDDGALTEAGAQLRRDIETVTDTVALGALAGLADDEVGALFAALTPLTRRVVAAGDVPDQTPMGLRRDELDDDSAHLG